MDLGRNIDKYANGVTSETGRWRLLFEAPRRASLPPTGDLRLSLLPPSDVFPSSLPSLCAFSMTFSPSSHPQAVFKPSSLASRLQPSCDLFFLQSPWLLLTVLHTYISPLVIFLSLQRSLQDSKPSDDPFYYLVYYLSLPFSPSSDPQAVFYGFIARFKTENLLVILFLFFSLSPFAFFLPFALSSDLQSF